MHRTDPWQLNAADSFVPFEGPFFEAARDLVGVVSRCGIRQNLPLVTVTNSPADSNIAEWTRATYQRLSATSDAQASRGHRFFLSLADGELVNRILNELDELVEPLRSSAVAKACRRFAEESVILCVGGSGIRYAVFPEDAEAVTLVAHSSQSKRQVSFEFGPEPTTVTIVRIDEKMCRSQQRCDIHHELTLRNALEWLSPH